MIDVIIRKFLKVEKIIVVILRRRKSNTEEIILKDLSS